MKRLLLLLPLLLTAQAAISSEKVTIQETSNSAVVASKDVLTDAMEYRLIIFSKNAPLNSIGVEEESALGLSCDEFGVNAYLPTNTYNGPYAQLLTMRWDSEKPIKEKWDNLSTGTVFNYKRAMSLLKQMSQKDRLVIQWRTYDGLSKYFVFDLRAVKNSIFKLQSVCEGY